MRKFVFLTFALLFSGNVLRAQNIACGLWMDPTQQFHFCRVNAATGQTIFSNAIPGLTDPAYFTSIVDITNNQYILNVNYPNDRYYSIDLTTGTVVVDAPATHGLIMLEIHPATGVVYGIWRDNSLVYHFVSVNVHSGVVNVISTLTGITGITGETSVLNPLTNQYTFVGNYSIAHYITIDISTGAIINMAPTQISASNLRIHPGTGVVYGMWYSFNSMWLFVSVNTLSGQYNVISNPTGMSTISLSAAFLNPIDGQYIISANYPADRYYTLDLATGATIIDTPAVQKIAFLEWCGFLTGIDENENDMSSRFAPNPFRDQTIITVDNPYNEKLTISVSDMSGRIFLKRVEQELHEVIIDRNQLGLKSGMYMVVINKDDCPVSQSKIIVQ